jgi:hypothetical protein
MSHFWHLYTSVTPKVFKFNRASNDGRRHSRGTYLFDLLWIAASWFVYALQSMQTLFSLSLSLSHTLLFISRFMTHHTSYKSILLYVPMVNASPKGVHMASLRWYLQFSSGAQTCRFPLGRSTMQEPVPVQSRSFVPSIHFPFLPLTQLLIEFGSQQLDLRSMFYFELNLLQLHV